MPTMEGMRCNSFTWLSAQLPQMAAGGLSCLETISKCRHMTYLSGNNGVVIIHAILSTLSKAHHCFPRCQCQQWRAWDVSQHHVVQPTTHRWLQEGYQFMWNFPSFSCISAAIMLLLSYKQASQFSSMLIIVAPGVNANNWGHGMYFFHMVSSTALKDDSRKNMKSACENFQNSVLSQRQ